MLVSLLNVNCLLKVCYVEEKLLQMGVLESDALRELGNIATGNAATALSNLLGKYIEIKVPDVKAIPISEFAEYCGGAEAVVVGTYLEITGDLTGESLYLFPKESAEKLVDLMLGREIGTSSMDDEMSVSAFKEMTNIVTGGYLSSIADFISSKLFPSIPMYKMDMLQSLLDFILVKASHHSDELLAITTKIEVKDIEIKGSFIVLFDVPSYNKLIETLRSFYQVD